MKMMLLLPLNVPILVAAAAFPLLCGAQAPVDFNGASPARRIELAKEKRALSSARLQEARTENQKIRTELEGDHLNVEIVELRRQVKQSEAQTEDFRRGLAVAKARVDKARAESEKLRTVVDATSNEVKTFKTTVIGETSRLNSEADALVGEKLALQAKMAKDEIDRRALELEISRLKEKVSESKVARDKLVQVVELAHSRSEQAQVQYETDKAESELTEARLETEKIRAETALLKSHGEEVDAQTASAAIKQLEIVKLGQPCSLRSEKDKAAAKIESYETGSVLQVRMLAEGWMQVDDSASGKSGFMRASCTRSVNGPAKVRVPSSNPRLPLPLFETR